MSPTLKKIQRLEMYHVSGYICDAIVKQNLQLSKLHIYHASSEDQALSYLLHPYENLEHLYLKWYNWNDIIYLKSLHIQWKL